MLYTLVKEVEEGINAGTNEDFVAVFQHGFRHLGDAIGVVLEKPSFDDFRSSGYWGSAADEVFVARERHWMLCRIDDVGSASTAFEPYWFKSLLALAQKTKKNLRLFIGFLTR